MTDALTHWASPISPPTRRFSDKKVRVSHGDRTAYVKGRRTWVKYRELGVTAASGAEMRAQVISTEDGGTSRPAPASVRHAVSFCSEGPHPHRF